MPDRAFRRALALLVIVGALLVASFWPAHNHDARGEQRPLAGRVGGQTNTTQPPWVDPMTMYEAYAMGSACFGCRQSFLNPVPYR